MTDHDPPDERGELPPLRLPPPVEPAAPRVLGVIPAQEHDTQLSPAPERREEPRRRRKTPAQERPALPRGALVTLVRSGGLVFRTSELTVYRDGRVTYDADGPGGARERAVWVLLSDELEELRRELAAIDFAAYQFTYGRQNPDAYAYELTARVGRGVRRITLAEGSIPDELDPLIRRLASYAPPSDQG
jgi:hypothetical protein